jgi:hypothetical protein
MSRCTSPSFDRIYPRLKKAGKEPMKPPAKMIVVMSPMWEASEQDISGDAGLGNNKGSRRTHLSANAL